MRTSIYHPREDSYMLARHIAEYASGKVLDMGTGSGILAQRARLYTNDILAVDVNQEAVNHVSSLGISAIQSDLFENIPKQQFDLIMCNPPYLPQEQLEPEDSALATTGGKKGSELIQRFLKQARGYLTKQGTILLIFSSLSGNIQRMAERCGYAFFVIDKETFDFETIYLAKIKKI